MQNDIKTTEEYFAKLDNPQKTELKRVYGIIMQLTPEAEEKISYGMPMIRYKNKQLVGIAAFKDHLSIFPGPETIKVLKDRLVEFKQSKGTIRFTVDKPIPKGTIEAIVKQRMNEINNAN